MDFLNGALERDKKDGVSRAFIYSSMCSFIFNQQSQRSAMIEKDGKGCRGIKAISQTSQGKNMN